jgi:hypothetical protein
MGKPKDLEKNVLQYQFSAVNPIWTALEASTDLCNEKPATPFSSYIKIIYFFLHSPMQAFITRWLNRINFNVLNTESGYTVFILVTPLATITSL